MNRQMHCWEGLFRHSLATRTPAIVTAVKRLVLIVLGASAITIVGCSAAEQPIPLASVDLPRMYGGWYIVATIPNFLERGVVGGYDVYSPGTADAIHEDFFMQRGGFDSKKQHFITNIAILPRSNNADWRVKPIWPLRLPFQIYYVDSNYRYTLFGEQNRRWGWIYSRKQIISDSDYRELLTKFEALGYDITRFRKVVQTPDQVGVAGFWSDGVHSSAPR